MSRGSSIFLKLRKAPAPELLLDTPLLAHQADLLVLAWEMDFSDLSDDDESAEMLLHTLGPELLGKHRDKRGILVTPASPDSIDARDYESGVLTHARAGFWLKNLAREPGVELVAAHQAEIPLPRFPKSKLVEFYVVGTARAMRELELFVPPLRTVRLELRTTATPREVSAFYLPPLKAEGLTVKRRVWSSGTAERLVASSESLRAFIHSEQRTPGETFIQISWVLLA